MLTADELERARSMLRESANDPLGVGRDIDMELLLAEHAARRFLADGSERNREAWQAIVESLVSEHQIPSDLRARVDAQSAFLRLVHARPRLLPRQRASHTPVLFAILSPHSVDTSHIHGQIQTMRDVIAPERSGSLHLETRIITSIRDLHFALLEDHYDIIHLSGHGTESRLCLEDEQAQLREVPPPMLAGLLASHANPMGAARCIVLSACWASSQRTALPALIPYTVGFERTLNDQTATDFFRAFYRDIARGKQLHQAFRAGWQHADLESSDELAFDAKSNLPPSPNSPRPREI